MLLKNKVVSVYGIHFYKIILKKSDLKNPIGLCRFVDKVDYKMLNLKFKEMKALLKIRTSVILVCFAVFAASCGSVAYTPKVVLDQSLVTVNKSVKVERFVDRRVNPSRQRAATNRDCLINSLDLEVTNAVVEDFSKNKVFENVGRHIDNPDLILKGEIQRFVGAEGMSGYAKFSMVSYLSGVGLVLAGFPVGAFLTIPVYGIPFGIPTKVDYSTIELRISIYNAENELLGAYTGSATTKKASGIYTNNFAVLPSMTNRMFSEVVQQIRDQIADDPKLFE